ncbi:hypothetical protein [Hippea alviniae]|uniref:hypothetical protein n=1 Tax=Hippea alviniae TaxID=1279027 RepID=UPI0003B32233|nr:hypothetical protein [Hippea alviniae]
MMDFAQVKILTQDRAKEKEKVRSVAINPLSIASTVIIAIMIYLIGYQNMLISEVKHEINIKKSRLNSLMLERQSLVKTEKSLLNSKAVFKNFQIAGPENITIVH